MTVRPSTVHRTPRPKRGTPSTILHERCLPVYGHAPTGRSNRSAGSVSARPQPACVVVPSFFVRRGRRRYAATRCTADVARAWTSGANNIPAPLLSTRFGGEAAGAKGDRRVTFSETDSRDVPLACG